MMLWEAKATSIGTYTVMKTPSGFTLDGEDLDNNSYRSIANGNLNRTIIGKKWLSAKFEFNFLTESELESIVSMINNYPLYVRFKSPIYGTNGIWEGQVYCSKWSVNMQQNKTTNGASESTWNSLSFTLVQSKKVSGQ